MITSGIIVRVVNRPLETRAVDGTFSTGVLARHDDYLVAALASILMADAGTVRNGHAEGKWRKSLRKSELLKPKRQKFIDGVTVKEMNLLRSVPSRLAPVRVTLLS